MTEQKTKKKKIVDLTEALGGQKKGARKYNPEHNREEEVRNGSVKSESTDKDMRREDESW